MVEEEIEDITMATSTITAVTFSLPSKLAPATTVPGHRPRRISPAAGQALEILGHAIEYLTDEFVHEGGSLDAADPQIEAIRLLMARNREIYFACPEIPRFRERFRSWLRRR